MIPAAHQSALEILLLAVGLLFFILVGTVALSQFKKRKAEVDPNELNKSKPATNLATGPEVKASTPPKEIHQATIQETSQKSLQSALSNTENSIFGRMRGLFKTEISSSALDEIEEILYTSDLGPKTVEKFMSSLRASLSRSELKNLEALKSVLRKEFESIFSTLYPNSKNYKFSKISDQFKKGSAGCTVIMVVGVNGAGKTTSIGKLAASLAEEGQKVLVAAGDTFRAAAGAQLSVWTERAQVEIFSPPGVSDPSAVAFDAISKGKAQNLDVVIVDTAGRLHTQANLMEELKKMKRVMSKVIAEAPHETLIVLDANQGQNALQQAREFNQAIGLTGCILTKMDGTAKGGVALGLVNEIGIPIKLIGVGEKVGDLQVFDPSEFSQSILGRV